MMDSLVLGLFLLFLIWFFVRNERVYRFRNHLIDTVSLAQYRNAAGYSRMLWSLKPLKQKYWIK